MNILRQQIHMALNRRILNTIVSTTRVQAKGWLKGVREDLNIIHQGLQDLWQMEKEDFREDHTNYRKLYLNSQEELDRIKIELIRLLNLPKGAGRTKKINEGLYALNQSIVYTKQR